MPGSDETARLAARIRGRVQGVGFRAFAQREAERLGLSGFVRNEPDGSVTVEAEGARSALEALLEALRRGPRHAAVADVAVHWEAPRGGDGRFVVRYD